MIPRHRSWLSKLTCRHRRQRHRSLGFLALEPRRLLAAAALDPNFSGDGKLITDFSGAQDRAYDATLQSDGKLVVVGSSGSNMAIARYTATGALDTTFSGDGRQTVSIGSGEDIAYAVTTQPDGKILAVGTASSPNNANHDIALARFNADGTLDPTFGGDGTVRFSPDWTLHDYAFAVATQPDGKILVGGSRQVSSQGNRNLVVLRFLPDGSIDPSFNGDGFSGFAIAEPEALEAIHLSANGKITGVGYNGDSYAVARIQPNGAFDSGLDGDGWLIRKYVTNTTDNVAKALTVQPDGKILIAGHYTEQGVQKIALSRLSSNGSVDTSFGVSGVVTSTIGSGGQDRANDMKLQPDGKLVVVGSTKVGNYQKFAVLRYNLDGSLDHSFTLDGHGTVSFGNFDDEAHSVVIQPDGNLLVVGTSFDGGDDNFAVARLLPATPNQPPVADAGGPYDVAEGTPFRLDGTRSSDERPASATYEWDLDYDGESFHVHVVGDQPTVSYPDDFALRTIALRVTDSDGLSTIATTTVTVSNIAPALYASGLERTDLGRPYTLHLESRDPGDDTLVSWNVSWGDGTSELVYGDPVSVTHAYPDGPGSYLVTVTGTDEDGTYAANSLTTSVEPVSPANGAIDTTFAGNAGWVSTALGPDAVANDAMQQPNGKIVLVGTAGLKVALARYYPDGSLDRTFGGGGTGQVITSVTGTQRFGDVANSVALAPDGRIVIAGQADFPNGTNRDFLVARYTDDGVLDPTFGNGGTIITSNTTRADYAFSVAVQADGKIVAGGLIDNSGNGDFLLVRYNVDGSLDASFSGDGKHTNELGGTTDRAHSILVQPDGRILAAGTSAGDFALSRNLSNGPLDTSFSGDGLFKIAIGAGTEDTLRSVLRLPDGKYLVAGYYELGLKERLAIARVTSAGALDLSFGIGGIATTDVTYADDFGYDMAVDSTGRIVLAGFMNNGAVSEVIVSRFTESGQLDPTFYGDGTYSAALSRVSDEGRAVVLGLSDEIYVAGTTSDGDQSHFLLTRFAPTLFDPSLPPTAYAGDNYIVAATDTSVTLDGSRTTDPDDPQAALNFEWDVDYDGITFDINAQGITPTISINPALLPRTVALRVTDPNGNVRFSTALLARNTDVPALAISGPTEIAEGATYSLQLIATGSGSENIGSWEVDWGDGTIKSYSPGTTIVQHVYQDGADSHTIRATASILTTKLPAPPAIEVQVIDVPPSVSVSGSEFAFEGSVYTLNLYHQDPGADPLIDWIIDWGDGFSTTWPGAASHATHIYSDGDSLRSIRATARNDDGEFQASSFAVVVHNAAPRLTIMGDAYVDLGIDYSLLLNASDPGADVITHWDIDWGDGVPQRVEGNPALVTHQFSAPGTYMVSATATDEDGTFSSNSLEVAVGPVALYPRVSGNSSVPEGSPYQLYLHVENTGPLSVSGWTIEWGNGQVTHVQGNPSSIVHEYRDGDSHYTIQAVVHHAGMDYFAPSQTITVENVSPRPLISGPATIEEGAEYELRLSTSDPGEDTIQKWVIDWGDGTVETIGGNVAVVTHRFDDGPHTYVLTADVTDEDGTFSSNELEVLVTDVPAVIAIDGPPQIDEGATYRLALFSDDRGDDQIDVWWIDWGDGSPLTSIGGDSSFAEHEYRDGPSAHTIRAWAEDHGELRPTPSLDVFVDNVPPLLTLSGPDQIAEGAQYLLKLSASDPGEDTITEWIVDWGDGSARQSFTTPPGTIHHIFEDGPAHHTITVTANDEDGSYTAVLPVDVVDVPPQWNIIAPRETIEGAEYQIELFANDPGRDEIVYWEIEWGEGTSQSLTGDHVVALHRFSDGPDQHVITVRAMDTDGVSITQAIPVTVHNAAPELRIFGNATTTEGADYTLNLSSIDPGEDTVVKWVIDWGDGLVSEVDGNPSTATHPFSDGPATFVITAAATDEDGTFFSNAQVVQILDSPPHLSISGDPEGYESRTYQLHLSVQDPGEDFIDRWWIDWGDGETELVEGSPSSLTHIYADGEETYVIRATARNEDGEFPASNEATVVIRNIAPHLILTGDGEAMEGIPYSIYFSAYDPGLDTIDHWTIDWGDGIQDTLPGNPTSATHIYRDGERRHRIAASATDEDGTWHADLGIDVLVRDVAPEPIVIGPAIIEEGSPLVLELAVNDPGDDIVSQWIIDWGDGTTEILLEDLSRATHTYADGPAGYAIRATVVNEDASYPAAPFLVAVSNVPPELTLNGPPTIVEGASYELKLASQDPGTDTITQWMIDWGDGFVEKILGNPNAVMHTYKDGEHRYIIRAVATDEDGLWTASTEVLVLDQPPVVTLTGEAVINEGGDYTITFDAVDSGEDSISSWTVYWGDGTEEIVPGHFTSAKHVYTDGPGLHKIRVTAHDEDGTHPALNEIVVTVLNVPPTILDLTSSSIDCGSASEKSLVTVTAEFTDPGIVDTHQAWIDWGDGTVTAAGIIQGSGQGTLQGAHRYISGGQYTITVKLADGDGGMDTETTSVFVAGVGTWNATLFVIGTDQADHITINAAGPILKVHADFLEDANYRSVPSQEIERIVVFACGGGDHVTISSGIRLPVTIHGGSGDDHLNGGSGWNVIVGGDGNDRILGGNSRDILIGSAGADRLIGNGGEDLLIGDSMLYTANDAAMAAILAEWTSDRTWAQRVYNLSRGTAGPSLDGSRFSERANGEYFLVDFALDRTVFDDGEDDDLVGSAASNWLVGDLPLPSASKSKKKSKG